MRWRSLLRGAFSVAGAAATVLFFGGSAAIAPKPCSRVLSIVSTGHLIDVK
jgi:hypothetical protein